jgi:hypothetical protein
VWLNSLSFFCWIVPQKSLLFLSFILIKLAL